MLEEVTAATRAALAGGRRLTKDELHDELRRHTSADLQPWCSGCGSHHVAPVLWRYATIAAGVRLDARRAYLLDDPAPFPPPAAAGAVRRFLHHYGPATPGEFTLWAGLPGATAKALWAQVAPDLAEVRDPAGRRVWLLPADADELADPPASPGVRLLPPGDPLLHGSTRSLLAPDPALRKKLFRPVASPGVLLSDGGLAGTWRLRRKGRRAVLEVEAAGPARLPASAALADEAHRVASLKGATDVTVQRL